MAFTYRRDGTPNVWAEWRCEVPHSYLKRGKEESCEGGTTHRQTMETEDEAEALNRAKELEAVARGDAPAAAAGELTVEAFAKGEWLKMRKQSKEFAWRDDQSRLKHHFLGQFGSKPIKWLETDDGGRALFSWAVGLKAHKAKRDGEALAPRTVWNTFSTVRLLLDDAVELKRLKLNPLASFKAERHLPTKADKQDGWRQEAGFSVEQVVSLTTSAKLSERRRVWNTLAFMCGGARTGELANLRWRDWTESYTKAGDHKGKSNAAPGGATLPASLGRLVIAKAYNSREGKEKATKTGAKKLIPVHPFAAEVLKAWHASGWQEWMGRDHKPEDFIVPQSDGKQVPNWKLLDEFYADLDILKIDRQRQYENRSTFRNLLLCAAAPEFIVNLMTHPSPKQASDFYTRLEMQWPAMCEAILRLDHPAWRSPVGEVTARVTAAAASGGGGQEIAAVAPEVIASRADIAQSVEQRFRKEWDFSAGQRSSVPDVPESARTFPALAIVPFPMSPDDSASLPAVTTGAFMDMVLEAEFRHRLRRLAGAL